MTTADVQVSRSALSAGWRSLRPADSGEAARDDLRDELVVVANRLPYRMSEGSWVRSPGGLVSALLPVTRSLGGSWIGWAGVTGRLVPPQRKEGLTLRAVPVSEQEAADFYDGYANAGLWPLLHDAIRPPGHDSEWWRAYRVVNHRFALAVARSAACGARVLVNDYQLMLVPELLRQMRPDLRTAFFLHTPFPRLDVLREFPDCRDLLLGMLGADVVGLQSARDARRFGEAAERLVDARVTQDWVTRGVQRSQLGVFPVAVDAAHISQVAASDATRTRTRQIRAGLGDPAQLLLGVDRLDYTKGIETRLLAYHWLLRNGILDARRTPLLQIAVPSRENVADYRATKQRVIALTHAINGEFGSIAGPAVHLRFGQLDEGELIAHYRAADVMLVTPLRDGMNLVAKEYVATRFDNSGALVLSTGAGAAAELRVAHLVPPGDVAATADAISKAVSEDALGTRRMKRLRAAVFGRSVHDWAHDLVESLG